MSGATDALCEDGPIFTTTTDKIDEADLLQSKLVDSMIGPNGRHQWKHTRQPASAGYCCCRVLVMIC
ncbi:hypothetical protein T07_6495 [Trichinella nelsoni]|uniref:Uncharacterized protein n=1 Tax=Trichinella nelsoni TaxID=6336 RepID=A0A0V0SIH1_9BILA|nr:hypothetical protein T07_6495 [Trichinella nelsoni]